MKHCILGKGNHVVLDLATLRILPTVWKMIPILPDGRRDGSRSPWLSKYSFRMLYVTDIPCGGKRDFTLNFSPNLERSTTLAVVDIYLVLDSALWVLRRVTSQSGLVFLSRRLIKSTSTTRGSELAALPAGCARQGKGRSYTNSFDPPSGRTSGKCCPGWIYVSSSMGFVRISLALVGWVVCGS